MEISGIQKHFRNRMVLNSLNFSVERGSITAIVGPNGAGKSTLLNILMGLMSPSLGEVRVFENLSPGSEEMLKRVAFVGQDSPLPQNMSVKSLLDMVSRLNPRFEKQFAMKRIESLGIILNSKIKNLSGGQRSEVALTIAFARKPEILILDEPMANLDPLARNRALSELMDLAAEQHTTILLSTHAINEVEQICDTILIIAAGNLVLFDTIEEVTQNHLLLTCSPPELDHLAHILIVDRNFESRISSHLVRVDESFRNPELVSRSASLQRIVLGYLRREQEIQHLNMSAKT